MTPSALQIWSRRRVSHGLLVALLATGCAVVARFVVDPLLPPGYPFLTFFPAVVLCSYFAGWRMGALTALLCGLAAWYYFIPPVNSFALANGVVAAIGAYLFIIAIDIILLRALDLGLERRRAAERRAISLAEQREVLMQELQHRVGNNLQFVSALLRLEARRVSDPEARRVLTTAESRVGLVGRIQRHLIETQGAGSAVGEVIDMVGRTALDAAGAQHLIFTVEGDAEAPAEIMQTVAIIVLECINNAVEHGFPDAATGRIAVTTASPGGALRIVVADDGVGISPSAQSSSLGLNLCRKLAQGLNATLEVRPREGGGTEAILVCPLHRPPSDSPTTGAAA